MEQKFTASISKLIKQHERFDEWEQGILRPITLTLIPTNRCNLNCSWCQFANSPKIDLDCNDAFRALRELKELGLKSVILTGGGEPTVYKQFRNLIAEAVRLKLELGLLTNGILLKEIGSFYLDQFTWIRVSMNALGQVDELIIPGIKGTLGFGYVVSEYTEEETICKIFKMLERDDVEYLRLAPNCLSIKEIEKSKRIAKDFRLLGHDKVFWRHKDLGVPERCYMPYLKPLLNCNGYFYRCSPHALHKRKLDFRFRIGKTDQIDEIWNFPVKPFATQYCVPGTCFYREQNDFIDLVVKTIEHRNFL